MLVTMNLLEALMTYQFHQCCSQLHNSHTFALRAMKQTTAVHLSYGRFFVQQPIQPQGTKPLDNMNR